MIKRLSHVAPLQCGTVLAVLYGLLSLVFAPHNGVDTGAFGGGMVVIAVLLPIFYAVIGFIGGVIAAFIYNLVAGWTGGLELTFVDVPPAIPAQTTSY